MIKAILDGELDGNNLPATSYTPTYAVTPENIDQVWDGSAAFAAASDWAVQTIDDYNAEKFGIKKSEIVRSPLQFEKKGYM